MHDKKLPPSTPKTHWLFGNTMELKHDSLGSLLKWQKEFGSFYSFHRVNQPHYVATNPNYIKYVLQDNNKNYHKGKAFEYMKALLGNGLVTNEGEFWRKQRRMAQPAFHKVKLAKLTEAMTGLIEEFLDEWEQKYQSGDRINLSQEMNLLALKIVSKALFQSEVGDAIYKIGDHLNYALYRMMMRLRNPFLPPRWVPTAANRKEQKAIKELFSIIDGIIAERQQDPQEYNDLLAMLMHSQDEDTGEKMSNQQLRDEVMTLFMAGHESSSAALGYLFWLLSQYPDIDQRVDQELAANLGNEAFTFESFRKVPYSSQVINEVLRLYPPAWTIGRKAVEDDEIDGYHVPAGTSIMIPSYVVHRDADLWEQPNEFLPDRWQTQRVKELPRFAYFPFGGGPRLCIGDQFALLEIHAVLALLKRRFTFEHQARHDIALQPLITMRPVEDIYVTLVKRV
jgi:cytochrome P450